MAELKQNRESTVSADLRERSKAPAEQRKSTAQAAKAVGASTRSVEKTAAAWCSEFLSSDEISEPPSATDANPWGSIQHFDLWSFASNNREGGGPAGQRHCHGHRYAGPPLRLRSGRGLA